MLGHKPGKVSGAGMNVILGSDRKAHPVTKNLSGAVDQSKSLRDWEATRRWLPFLA
jgi:hypothetical protein